MQRPISASETPVRPVVKGYPIAGDVDFEQVEHLVNDSDPDTALCGVDQTDVGWNLGWPVCQACVAVADGRMS
jgi:hypothetical protein